VDADATIIEFLMGQADAASELANGSVAIQYVTRRGVCRIDGVAQRTKEAGAVRVAHTGAVELIQRREFVRIDAMVPVSYLPLGKGGWTAETTTINVSGGGFMISGREGLRMDEVCEFTLELDGEREAGTLVCDGQVVRETAGGLGISIVTIDEDERERLIRWVFARERLSRQIVKGV
jgi:c-di-GMP-binding flagellar brake protein YcgR